MKNADLQHDNLIEAAKAAKVRNADAFKTVYQEETVTIFSPEFKTEIKCTIKESLFHLNAHGYEYESLELERVINILNKI